MAVRGEIGVIRRWMWKFPRPPARSKYQVGWLRGFWPEPEQKQRVDDFFQL